MLAVQGGYTATAVALALECGVDLNAVDNNGCTALILAAANGHTATVVALAQDCGADMNTANQHGFTAIMCTAQD